MNKLMFGSAVAVTLWTFAAALAAQTTTTDCNLYGNTANCTSTTTPAQPTQQQRNEQASQQGQQIGAGLAPIIQAARYKHQFKKYCNAHQGENWTYTLANGTVAERGVCPGVMSEAYAREMLIKSSAVDAKQTGVAIYSTVNGAVLTTHSERASETRLHLVIADEEWSRMVSGAHITTFVYTNDKDVNLTYNLKSNQLVK